MFDKNEKNSYCKIEWTEFQKPYRRVVNIMWLDYMASHKYFNYTGLINTPLCEVKTSCTKKTLVWLLIYRLLYYCIPYRDAFKLAFKSL